MIAGLTSFATTFGTVGGVAISGSTAVDTDGSKIDSVFLIDS